jgi:hypothetical protein
MVVEHEQASGLRRGCRSVGSRQAAHNNPSRAQHGQGGGQANAAGARLRQIASVDLSEQTARAVWSNLHDRCTRSLQVSAIVKITNQDVSFEQGTGAPRNASNAIRIYLAIGWNRRGDDGNAGLVAEMISLRLDRKHASADQQGCASYGS